MPGSPCTRIAIDSRALVRRLNKSLSIPTSGWVVVAESVSPICLEFKDKDVTYRIELVPRFGSCIAACCDRITLKVNGTLIPLPFRQANKLRKHTRMFVIHNARTLSDTFPTFEEDSIWDEEEEAG